MKSEGQLGGEKKGARGTEDKNNQGKQKVYIFKVHYTHPIKCHNGSKYYI